MRKKVALFTLLLLAFGGAGLLFCTPLRDYTLVRIRGGRTVGDVMRMYSDAAKERILPHFETANVAFPPKKIALLAFKEERAMVLQAMEQGQWITIREYPILAASGTLGPKLREGDRQVPEGIYAVEGLNPNSSNHLSMKLDYPNGFERARAEEDGRENPGSNIFIHGHRTSIGCLAMGDDAIEELFVTASLVGCRNIKVIIAPFDMRKREKAVTSNASSSWLPDLYELIRSELAKHPENWEGAN